MVKEKYIQDWAAFIYDKIKWEILIYPQMKKSWIWLFVYKNGAGMLVSMRSANIALALNGSTSMCSIILEN